MEPSTRRSQRRVIHERDGKLVSTILKGRSVLSDTILRLYQSGSHLDILNTDIDPRDYDDPTVFGLDYQAVSLLSKYPFLRTGIDLEQAAYDKFERVELHIAKVNANLRCYEPLNYGLMPLSDLHHLLPKVRDKIRNILGRFSFDELVDKANWGPGVTQQLKGKTAVAPNKFQFETGMTQEVYDVLMPEIFSEIYPRWSAEMQEPVICKGSVICTVSKNAKANRIIMIEPGINLWFQKGLGLMIRQRLMKAGLNLSKGKEVNMALAKLASRTNHLSTIDFSSASDTISEVLVRLLLPPEWYRVLNLFRCKGYTKGGIYRPLHKFSSMGNGFTFELETLIFHAIALVCTGNEGSRSDEVKTFGDDVILPTFATPLFLEVASVCGFIVNEEKTHIDSPFRESCGGHYFKGVDVTPFFFKKALSNPRNVAKAHNRLTEVALRRGYDEFRHNSVRKSISYLRSLRFEFRDKLSFGPKILGDSVLWENLDFCLKGNHVTHVRKYQRPWFKIRTVSEVELTAHFDGVGLLLDRLWNPPIEVFGKPNKVALKGQRPTKVGQLTIPQEEWCNLGQWSN